MKREVRPDDNFFYYSYILCYVDDILVVHHAPKGILDEIDKFFKLKPASIGDPDIYLGAKLRKMTLNNGVWCWSISLSKYIQEAVCNWNAAAASYALGGIQAHKELVLEEDVASLGPYLLLSMVVRAHRSGWYARMTGCPW